MIQRKTFKFASILLALFLLFLSPLAIFYGRYEILANHLEDDLGYRGSAANAVKHAYAAAQLYSFLRIALDPSQAEKTVLFLGLTNEYVERVTKMSKPDSALEIMKDMHNNLAGILAARYCEENVKDIQSLDIVLRLAKENILIVSRNDNPFFKDSAPKEHEIVFAKTWFDSKNHDIKGRITHALDIFYPVKR